MNQQSDPNLDPSTKPGVSTVGLVASLRDEGADHIVLLMRHSAREFEPGRHDLLNPLTDEGRTLAREMGQALPKDMTIRGYSSPAERCVETADLLMAGHKQGGGRVTRNRVVEALGVFYVLDQMKMFKAMQQAGGLVSFGNRWFDGQIAPDILMPADVAAPLLAGIAHERLREAPQSPQLDVMVSHDFTLYTLKDQLLGQDTGRYPYVHFLDGIAFYLKDGELHARSHHEPGKALS